MKPASAWSLGIDLGGTKIHAELFDPRGRSVWMRRVSTPSGDYAATLGAVLALAELARERHAQLDGNSPRPSIGIGGPGTLTASGLIKNANSTCLNGRPLVHDLRALLHQEVRYANDANCLALSESRDGAGAGLPVVFAVILGTGAGAGLAVRGRLLEGANGLCGEWGHNPLPWQDEADHRLARARPCWCGLTGCIEAFVSGPALSGDHRLITGQRLSAEDIAERAGTVRLAGSGPAGTELVGSEAGDAECARSLARHAQRLARALASIINLIDPDIIVLAGGLSKMPHLVDTLPGLWGRHVFGSSPQEPVRTRLATAQHGDASGVRGAAWLWNDRPDQPDGRPGWLTSA